MHVQYFQVDAFAGRPLMGGPAGVVPLAEFLPDAQMQAIAREQNLSETAFIVPTGVAGDWRLRWFTPMTEVPLCGHATFAAGAIVLGHLAPERRAVQFHTASGPLSVARIDGHDTLFEMSLPASHPTAVPRAALHAHLDAHLGVGLLAVHEADYALAIAEDAAAVVALPRDRGVQAAAGAGRNSGHLIVAARAASGADVDVVYRFFAPGCGIAEDPATGSAVCLLATVFAPEFPDRWIRFHQAFPGRGATITAQWDRGSDRVILRGGAILVLAGALRVGE